MKQHFWVFSVYCNGCNKDATLKSALYSADGELKLLFWCFECKHLIEAKIFASALAHRALINDMDAEKRDPAEPFKAICPATAKRRPEFKFSSYDLEELHAQHILDDEEGNGILR